MNLPADLYDRFKLSVEGFAISTDTIIEILKVAMELIEGFTLAGPDKKSWVLDALDRLVRESDDLSEETKVNVRFVIQNILPTAIDLIVLATKGQLMINVKNACPCC